MTSSGGSTPAVSNANFVAGTTIANLSLVPVGADGAIAIKASVAGSVHVIAGVQGYLVGGAVSVAGAVVPVTPTRLLDTRTLAHVAGGGTVTLPVAGVAGVPADATAVVVNITVTGPTGPGFLTAGPAGQARPTAVDFDSPDLTYLPQGALINLTVTNPQASGWPAAYPYGVERPEVSNLDLTAGAVAPNLSLVTLGYGYGILHNGSAGSVEMVADVLAYVLT